MNPIKHVAVGMLLSLGVNAPVQLQKPIAAIIRCVNPDVSHLAATYGTYEEINFLHKHEFDLKRANKQGSTPLDLATAWKNESAACRLRRLKKEAVTKQRRESRRALCK